MKEVKLIIEERGGSVQLVYSNVPVKYVIVDYDELNIGAYPLSLPLEADAIEEKLYTLYSETDSEQAEIREGLKRLKF